MFRVSFWLSASLVDPLVMEKVYVTSEVDPLFMPDKYRTTHNPDEEGVNTDSLMEAAIRVDYISDDLYMLQSCNILDTMPDIELEELTNGAWTYVNFPKLLEQLKHACREI